MPKNDGLDELTRAHDIILGSLGIGGEAKVLEVSITKIGYAGRASWSDGEEFDFESDDELTDLESWAIEIINKE